jgi:hypothetical protein
LLLLVALAIPAVLAGLAGAQDKQIEDAVRAEKAARERALKNDEKRAAIAKEQAAKAKQEPQKDDARRALERQMIQLRANAQIRAAQEVQAVQLQAAMGAVRVQQSWPDEQFERWVFSQDQTADRARHKLESLLTSRVDEIERTCELTLTQVRKLRLMGQGDIKRFFDVYEKIKARFKAMNNDVSRLQEIQPDLAPVRATLQTGPFTDDSLLVKSLRTTLTDEQLTKYDTLATERRAFRHRANIELAVSMLEQAMPLRDAQRRELIALLEKETTPPRKNGPYEVYLVFHQMSHLPEAKLKGILSDTQKRVLDQQVAQFAANIANLRQNGLIVDDVINIDFAVPPPAAALPAMRVAPAPAKAPAPPRPPR